MSNKKVIGFDNWTGGAHLFERLVTSLEVRELNLLLLHLGSWGNDPNRPVEEQLGKLPIRDISYYGKKNFLKIIDLEKPDVVIFFSVDTFAHRAFNRYCRYRGIPTLHLYHGVVRVQAVDGNKPYKIRLYSQAWFVFERLKKAITKVWPTYVASLWVTGAVAFEWWRFITDIVNLTRGKYMPVSALDARTTRCGVYTRADCLHAEKKYGFKPEEVVAVGNPDLIMFGLESESIGSALSSSRAKNDDIIYIDTGLIYTGWVFSGADDFLNHLLFTKKELEQQGKKLVMKLHPQHYRSDFPAKLSDVGIEVIQNKDFVCRLQNCAAAIVEPSTAALIPGLVGVPVLLAQYGKLAGQPYGEILTSYPRARSLTDVKDISRLLAAEMASCDPIKVAEWISENAGPLPADQMPERVADIVAEIVPRLR